MARLSGLQKQALSLYRAALRAARNKQQQQQGGESLAGFARAEFERHRGIDRKDILRIEHLLRKGRRQLELLSSQDVTGLHVHPMPLPGGGSGGGGGGGGGSGSGS